MHTWITLLRLGPISVRFPRLTLTPETHPVREGSFPDDPIRKIVPTRML